MTPDKKLQQKGWSHNGYSQVRNKVNKLFDSEDFTPYFRAKRKKVHHKGSPHHFLKYEEKQFGFARMAIHYSQCDLCGKKKFEIIKGIVV